MTVDLLGALADRYWQARLEADPLSATMLGERARDDCLPDLSRAAEDDRVTVLRDIAREAEAIHPAGLGAEDRITCRTLIWEADDLAAVEGSRMRTFTVSAQSEGPQAALLHLPLSLTLPEPWHAEALVDRLRQSGRYLGQAAERLREGLRGGCSPPRVNVDRVIGQLDAYLATDVTEDPYLRLAAPPAWSGPEEEGWRDALSRVVADVLRPALARYRACLAEEIAARARPPERCGLRWLPDGDAVYAVAARSGTTVDVAPEELHRIGVEAVEELTTEYGRLGASALGAGELTRIFARLRDDPDLRFSAAEEVYATAQGALDRAQSAVPQVFGRLPETGCVVRPMAEHEVEHGTIAYYLPPSTDGTRPGTYYVNTYLPETRPRFEAEALAFHEAVPGHHLQIALAQELDELPAFRRQSQLNAYVEGWALYTERLVDEIGLYSTDLDRLGMLSFDSWRSCRLVVDTGLHAFGWDRDRAIAYLQQHSPLARNNIVNEVDRYIAMPGQALGYKVGQRELLRLRADAREVMGRHFTLAGFHDEVLGHGPLPLDVLTEVVGEWSLMDAR